MNVKASGSRNGRGTSSGSAAPAPLNPATNGGGGGTNVEVGAIGGGANPIMADGSEGIPLGLSKLGREDLEVRNLSTVEGVNCLLWKQQRFQGKQNIGRYIGDSQSLVGFLG